MSAMYIFSTIGMLATGLFALWLAFQIKHWLYIWSLRRDMLTDAANDHARKISNHEERIDFLERCERDRTREENKACRKPPTLNSGEAV